MTVLWIKRQYNTTILTLMCSMRWTMMQSWSQYGGHSTVRLSGLATRRIDQFSVARYGKGAQTGCDYTEGEMLMITGQTVLVMKQVMQICRYFLSHSYVHVRHKLYKRGLGAPMGGVLSDYYVIVCCSRREATSVTPRPRELVLPEAVCRYVWKMCISQ